MIKEIGNYLLYLTKFVRNSIMLSYRTCFGIFRIWDFVIFKTHKMLKRVQHDGFIVVHNYKKIIILISILILLQNISLANDIIEFDFPNEGWHYVESPDGINTKKCYVPVNQTSNNYNEMLIFQKYTPKHEGINALVMLNKQLGKDKNNYKDISVQYAKYEENNAMALWCSKLANICSIKRAFKGDEGIIIVSYINKMPHYSQNIFSQWTNILASVKVNDNKSADKKNLIELD